MEDTGRQRKNYVGYEYKEIIAESGHISFLLDGYECFGWELDERRAENRESKIPSYPKKEVFYLKRNRKIINKMELTRLQRNFEACAKEIETLEKSKTSAATIYALVAGVIGTAFMAGSVFAVTAQPPHIILSIILAVPAFIGWIIPYFLYRKAEGKRTEKLEPLIEQKYDEIYEICEKGNKLLGK